MVKRQAGDRRVCAGPLVVESLEVGCCFGGIDVVEVAVFAARRLVHRFDGFAGRPVDGSLTGADRPILEGFLTQPAHRAGVTVGRLAI